MNEDIITNSLFLKLGDIFFCDLTAERYIDLKVLELSSKIFVNIGFFDRLKSNFNQNNGSSSSSNAGSLIFDEIQGDLSKKSKIIEIKDFQKTLVSSLKSRYKIPKNIFAVTGTKGKTSTAWYIFNLLNLQNLNACYFGSIGFYGFSQTNKRPFLIRNLDLTTPCIDDIYRIMNESVEANYQYIVFEASNHAIHQDRFLGIDVNVSTFTNIGNDHLDYFKTFQNGFDAKKKLFSHYTKDLAVLNADIKEFQEIYDVCKKHNLETLRYGKNGDIKLINIEIDNFQQKVSFEFKSKIYYFSTKIVGEFQIYNILAAACNLLFLKIDIENIVNNLQNLSSPVGRLEFIDNPLNRKIYVDFSHNPESLFYTLKSIKNLILSSNKKSKIITIFGCGGQRDRVKRPVMGFIATRLSDVSIITNDNIRNENEDFIIEEILQGINVANEELEGDKNIFSFEASKGNILQFFPNFKELKKNIFLIEKNRSLAIEKGLNLMEPDDILIIAGKGNEEYQIIGNEKIYFSDKNEVNQFFIKN